jgi:hypothetical protein
MNVCLKAGPPRRASESIRLALICLKAAIRKRIASC